MKKNENYQRYHLETRPAPNIVPLPNRFLFKIKRPMLALHIVKDLVEFWPNLAVTTDRPCVYGVLDSPIGGMAPRPHLCVGCLRCTTQNPETVQIHHNPAHQSLGDSYFTSVYFAHTAYEAETGSIPVKGAGYRGRFGGKGWDRMWTDMSEIVRPTRDGIHGREFISTAVDIGTKPPYLQFGSDGQPAGTAPHTFTLPVPFLFDPPPDVHLAHCDLLNALSGGAQAAQTLAILPAEALQQCTHLGPHLVPLVKEAAQLDMLPSFTPRMVTLAGGDAALAEACRARFPEALIAARLPADTAGADLLARFEAGVRVFHLVSDYHGQIGERFMLDMVRDAHTAFVEANIRDEVTLLGSGGIAAAEHVAKAIICGLDAVALDTPLLVALDGRFTGECTGPTCRTLALPETIPPDWGTQRLVNLMASWHDQLLEVLGAMGIRDARRLRGEMGRAMFQEDLERDAFGGIAGYD